MAKILVTVSALNQEIDTAQATMRWSELSDAQVVVDVDGSLYGHNQYDVRRTATAAGLRKLADMLERSA